MALTPQASAVDVGGLLVASVLLGRDTLEKLPAGLGMLDAIERAQDSLDDHLTKRIAGIKATQCGAARQALAWCTGSTVDDLEHHDDEIDGWTFLYVEVAVPVTMTAELRLTFGDQP